MAKTKVNPDSARAKKSRSERMSSGHTRIDCLINPMATKGMKRVMTVRQFRSKTELVETLILEEQLRIAETKREGKK